VQITENNKDKSLYASVGWLMLAKVIGFIFTLLLPLLVVRVLTKSDVGIYQQVFLVISTVSSILPFGFSMSAYYFFSREKENINYYLFNILLFNFITGGIACLLLNLFPQAVGNFFKDEEMTRFAPQIGLVVWFWIFSAFLEVVAIANQESRLATVFIILAQFTKSIFLVVGLVYWETVAAMLNAITIQVILQTIILCVYLNYRFKGFWKSFDSKFFVKHLKYALPFGISGVLWTLQTDLHNYFIANKFSPEQVAIYRVGCFELPLMVLLYEAIASVLIPKISKLQSEGKIREMIELTATAMNKLAFFYFPLFTFFLITAQTFITTLFTEKYAESVPIFLINIILLPTYIVITDPIVRSYESLGNFILKVRIFIVIGLIIFLWLGINYLNLQGMMIIVVCASMLDRVITSIKIWKTVGVKPTDISLLGNVWKTAIVSIIAGCFTFLFYSLTKGYLPIWETLMSNNLNQKLSHFIAGCLVLGISATIFAIIYLIGANYFGLIEENEKKMVTSVIAKLRRKSSTI
jgi:O-antigen/teichoic acid export membrane protein